MWSGYPAGAPSYGEAQQAGGGRKGAAKTQKQPRRRLEMPDPEPEPEWEEQQEEDSSDGEESEDVSFESNGRGRARSATASLDEHIAKAFLIREHVGIDGRRLVVGCRVQVEDGKHTGKEGELVMLDESKAVVIVPERGHRDAKRLVLMAAAQPDKTHWALAVVDPDQPAPEPERPRERAVSSLTGRPNRHARPRSVTSPTPAGGQVQPRQATRRPRWDTSTAVPGGPLAPETLARSETSDEWSYADADERASRRSSQQSRSEHKQSRRGSHTSSSHTSLSVTSTQSPPSTRSAQSGFTSPSRTAAAPPQHERKHEVAHSTSVHHAWGAQNHGAARTGTRLSIIAEFASWSDHSREMVGALREFSAGEGSPALEKAALQRESQLLATQILAAIDHSASFSEWLSKAATGPSQQLNGYVKASADAAAVAVAAAATAAAPAPAPAPAHASTATISSAPLPDGLNQVPSPTAIVSQQKTKAHPDKTKAMSRKSNGKRQTTARSSTKSAGSDSNEAHIEKDSATTLRPELLSPSRLSGIPRTKPASPSAIAENLSDLAAEARVAPGPPPVTAVAAATAAFAAERKQTTHAADVNAGGSSQQKQNAFVKQKPLQRNSQGKVARRSKTSPSPKRPFRPRGPPVPIVPPGLGWDGHSPTGTFKKGQKEKLPPARKPPAAVLSAAAREHKERKHAAEAVGRLDRNTAKGLTMRQFQRLRVQQNPELKPERAQAQDGQAVEECKADDIDGWESSNPALDSSASGHANGDGTDVASVEGDGIEEGNDAGDDDAPSLEEVEEEEEDDDEDNHAIEADASHDQRSAGVYSHEQEEEDIVVERANKSVQKKDLSVSAADGGRHNSQAEFDAIRHVIEAGVDSSEENFSSENDD